MTRPAGTVETIRAACAKTGTGPLTESALVEHIHPLFSRVLERNTASPEIYLANHSLGRPLDATAEDVRLALDLWYRDLDGAWGPWLDERDAYRARITRLIGRSDPRAVVPKTSAAQALRAVVNSLPTSDVPNIVSTEGEFDSIDFVLRAYHERGRAAVTRVPCEPDGSFDAERIAGTISDDTDLVVVSAVFFATGQILRGVKEIIGAAHRCGARVLLDAYHAAGVFPVAMDTLGCDAMMGGNYKYTRGGAGACWLALADSMLSRGGVPNAEDPAPIDTGWFAKREPFAYARTERPEYAPGGDGWLEATPPILTYYQARAGLELVLNLGLDRLRAYSLSQLETLRDRIERRGIRTRLMGNRPEDAGAYLLIPVPDGHGACAKLKDAGVIADARPSPAGEPWFVRLCPDILNTDRELDDAAARVAGVLA